MPIWKSLKRQILAGTKLDSYGERNTKEFLERLCSTFSLKESVPLNQRHNMALDPVGYIKNFEVIKSTSGENDWELVGDVYFHDVDIDEALKGFSYSAIEDIKGDIDNKNVGVYLPFPKYNDEKLLDDVLSVGENIVVGAWRKKAADPESIALIISCLLFVASPAYTNYWNNTISPLLRKLLDRTSIGRSVDYVQTSKGHKDETYGIYFIPVRGIENECLTLNNILEGIAMAEKYVLSDHLAKDKGVHLIKLIYSESVSKFEFKYIEYQDGSAINH